MIPNKVSPDQNQAPSNALREIRAAGLNHIGADVPQQCANDLASEMTAVANYNSAVKLAAEVGDNATREILEGILEDEDGHVNEIEEKLDQIKQMGVQHFLAIQAGE
jgi:bacterioferritin